MRKAPTRKRRLSGTDRRKQIIERASALFAQRGFDGVTIKDLAASCRINQAVLYHHFKSKRELHQAVVEEKIKQLDIESFLATLDRDQPIGELLKAVAAHILSIASRDTQINRLLLLGTLQKSAETTALFKAWRQPFVDYLHAEFARRIKAGEFRRVDPHITARSFIGMIMDCSVSCFLWPEFGYAGFDPEATVSNNVGVFLRGLES